MNTSLIFKNAILNLYKAKIYTVDYAILKASDYADKNKLTAEDYEELLTYLATEQEKSMKLTEDIEGSDTNVSIIDETVEETTDEESVENVEV